MFCYDVHHIYRSLRLQRSGGTFQSRTTAMAIGIADHPLSMGEILMTQVVGTASVTRPVLESSRNRSRPGRAPVMGTQPDFGRTCPLEVVTG